MRRKAAVLRLSEKFIVSFTNHTMFVCFLLCFILVRLKETKLIRKIFFIECGAELSFQTAPIFVCFLFTHLSVTNIALHYIPTGNSDFILWLRNCPAKTIDSRSCLCFAAAFQHAPCRHLPTASVHRSDFKNACQWPTHSRIVG